MNGSGARTAAGLACALICVAVPAGREAVALCAGSPAPIVDLDMERRYSDAVGSTADAALEARHRAEAEPLRRALEIVTRAADAAIERRPGRRDAADIGCGRALLLAWARKGALLGTMHSKQAEYQRKWDTTGFALAYLKLRPLLTVAERAEVDGWLTRLAGAARTFASAPGRKRNNHWYWLGLGLGAVGLATGDASLWDRAHGIYRDALADIAPDGTLPLEMARGARALHYHDFSLMPLVTLAELAAARGEDWYGERGGAIHRLAAVTLDGLADPDTFAKAAGLPPQVLGAKPGTGWRCLYGRRHPAAGSATDFCRSATRHRWLGGDVRNLAAAAVSVRERQP